MMFKEAARKHAIQEAPKESCGIVVNDKYYPCNNISDTPEDNFAIHPKDFLKARLKGTLQYVIHSHPEGGNASEQDKKACTATKLPWYIFLLPEDTWQIINP
jgi:proteasome lid subunit RPN8/RPN11